MLHHQPLIWTLTHHEEQQTNVHNLQTTKHKKNKKEVKKKNAAPPMFMMHNRLQMAFSASRIQRSKSSIRASLPYIIRLGLSHTTEFADTGPGH
jgi:hypothetical protein